MPKLLANMGRRFDVNLTSIDAHLHASRKNIETAEWDLSADRPWIRFIEEIINNSEDYEKKCPILRLCIQLVLKRSGPLYLAYDAQRNKSA